MFEENKWYKFVDPAGFCGLTPSNKSIASIIKSQTFKVVKICQGTVIELFVGDKILSSDDLGTGCLICEDEFRYFEEVNEIQFQTDNKELIAVFINGTEQFVIGPLAKKELDSRIKDFLIEDGRIVKIFEHTANASISVYYEDVK